MSSEKLTSLTSQCLMTGMTIFSFQSLEWYLDVRKIGYAFMKNHEDRDSRKLFRWRDHITFLLFSGVISLWCLFCLYWEPRLLEDFMHVKSPAAAYMTAFALGYHVYHFYTWKANIGFYQLELLIHHLFVCGGCIYVLGTDKFHGGTSVILLTDVATFFSQVRGLLLRCNQGKSTWYSFNRLGLYLSTVIFRFPADFWLVDQFCRNWFDLTMIEKSSFLVGTVFMVPYHIYLFVIYTFYEKTY